MCVGDGERLTRTLGTGGNQSTGWEGRSCACFTNAVEEKRKTGFDQRLVEGIRNVIDRCSPYLSKGEIMPIEEEEGTRMREEVVREVVGGWGWIIQSKDTPVRILVGKKGGGGGRATIICKNYLGPDWLTRGKISYIITRLLRFPTV